MEQRDELILQRVEAAMTDFRNGMQRTHDLSVRIGSRTTQFIRILIICFLLLGLILAYLISTLKGDMGGYLVHMEKIDQSVVQMANAVEQMQMTTRQMADTMQANLTSIPPMYEDISKMVGVMTKLERRLQEMDQKMGALPGMAQDTRAMYHELTAMRQQLNQEMQFINDTLVKMGFDMRDISKPMRMFPN